MLFILDYSIAILLSNSILFITLETAVAHVDSLLSPANL